MAHRTLVRVVAFLILLLAGAELFACDLISPETCELQTSSHDDCLCCCCHLVLSPPFDLAANDVASAAPRSESPAPPSLELSRIDHPPRA